MAKDNFIKRYFKNARLCERVEFFVFLAAILVIQSIGISKLSTFFVLNDEFGYFANAAYFAGLDWSSSASVISYYSYGYSLLLTPLFWILNNSVEIYRAALGLNVALIGGCFVMAKLTAKKLAPSLSGRLLNVICFVVCLYPSYIVMSKIAHTEALQYFLFWLITYLVISMAEKPTYLKSGFIALAAVYMYTVHQRSLGTLIAVGLVMLIMALKKRVSVKKLIPFVGVVAVCIAAHIVIKKSLLTDLRGNGGMSEVSDYAYMTSRLDYMLSAEGIKNLLKRTSGHFYYLSAASLMFGLYGLLEIILKIIDTIKNTSKKKNTDALKDEPINYVFIFMLVAMCITAAVSIYFVAVERGRLDTMIYGRYIETVIGPAILMGFIGILTCKKHLSLKATGCTIFAVLATLFAYKFTISTTNIEEFGATSVTSLTYLPNGGMHWNIMRSALFAILVFAIFVVIAGKLAKFRYLLAAAVLAVGGCFVRTGFANAKFTVFSMASAGEKYNYLVNKIEEDGEGWPVYYTLYGHDFTRNRPSTFIQLRMLDETLRCVDKTEIKDVTEDKYLFIYNELNDETIELAEGYELLMMSEELMLLKSGGEGISDGIAISGLSTTAGATADENGAITSAGEEAMFMFGPYINVSPGSYIVTMDVEVKSCDKDCEKLGYIDIATSGGKNIHGLYDIMTKDVKNGKLHVEIPISSEEAFKNLEIRATATKNSIITISNVKLTIAESEAVEAMEGAEQK